MPCRKLLASEVPEMSFTCLIGNDNNKEILNRLLRRGEVGRTLLFAGPDGTGKRQFALTLAKATNCQETKSGSKSVFPQDSCDECSMCNRIDAGACGDVVEIKPDGNFIKIAQTRALAEEIQFRPRETRQRFFIIDEADKLREEAAHSLLKTLEEPPATSTIILITARPDALLITIRSRAQQLNFAPLSIAEMEKYLSENYKRPAPDTALLARVTGGRIGQTTAIDLSEYRRERREVLEMLELLAARNDRVRLVKAAEYYGKQERQEFEKRLGMIASLLRDALLLASGRDYTAILNNDEQARLQRLAQNTGVRELIRWAEGFDELRSHLKVNINRQLATEALLLQLNELPRAARR